MAEPPRDSRDQPRLRRATSRVLAMGNLTRDADLQYTQRGQAVTNLSVAVNERVGREQAERVGFYRASAWGEFAEKCAGLNKGEPW